MFESRGSRNLFMDRAARLFKADVDSYLKKNGLENTKENVRTAAEEALVEQTVKGGVQAILDEFASKVMRWARKIFPTLSMTRSEARDFIRKADSGITGEKISQKRVFSGKSDGKGKIHGVKYNTHGRANTLVKVIEIDSSSIPVSIKNTAAMRDWLLNYHDFTKPVIVLDTGVQVNFTPQGLRASLKRRGSEHRKAYTGLRELVENAIYYESVPADDRHHNLEGQDIYYSAMKLNEKFYSVRIKVDIEKNKAERNYKDHKIAEIGIAPVVYQGLSVENRSLPARTGAIDTLKLSDLVAAVKQEGKPDIRYSLKDREPATLADLGISTEYRDIKKTGEDGSETTEKHLTITGNFKDQYRKLMPMIGGEYRYQKVIRLKGESTRNTYRFRNPSETVEQCTARVLKIPSKKKNASLLQGFLSLSGQSLRHHEHSQSQ